MVQEDPEKQAFWAISQTLDSSVAWWKIAKKLPLILARLIIRGLVTRKEYNVTKIRREAIWDDVWYEKFENIPIVKPPTSYHPDYFFDQGLDFVSPKLFKLLDRAQGSLQVFRPRPYGLG